MRKKLPFLSVCIILFPVLAHAGWISLNKQNTSPIAPKVTLVSDDHSGTVLKIEISGFDMKDFTTSGKTYQKVDLLSEIFTNQPGYPELAYLAKVLAIPDQAGMSVEVLETGEIHTFDNINLPPARKSWIEGSPETAYTENTAAYNSMSAWPADLVQIDPPSIFRDFRIARVAVYPLRYIAATKQLEVISSMTVRINYGPGDVINPKTSAKKPIAPSFGKIYQSFIFNYQSVLDNLYGGKEEGHELMLCIMPDAFFSSFQTYADWKRKSGIDIHITKFSDIGATASDPDIIKNHITDAYHNWDVPPTYVLIVGDYGVFPHKIVSYDYSFPNEDFFVEIEGDDFFPEMMIGRFTNESDYGMQIMINKFQMYEQTPYTLATDWFKKGICCSNNAYSSQVETKRYAAERMLQDGGFISVDTMMSDSPCTYSVADVVAAINDGRSFLNYRGEGWSTGWWASCTPMVISDVTGLNNGQKFTFVTSIGCGVAMFNSSSSGNCFGEEWIEEGTLSSPKGAVAFVGPTSNTHTAYNNNIDRGIYTGMFQEGLETPGEALLRGKLYMYNIFGNDPWVEYHYRVYCVLGDPSIHIWKDIPQAVTVNYPNSIPFGNNLVEFTVTNTASGQPVANAVVCVTGNTVFSTGHTDANGKAYLDITDEVQESLNVTVRGGGVYPYQGTLLVVQPDGAYVVRESFSLNDIAGGNGNSQLDWGESIMMSLSMKNIGTAQANNVAVTLSSGDPYITFTDNFNNYGNIVAGQTVQAVDAFAFDVADSLPDGHTILINVAAASGTTWNSYFSIGGKAPVLSSGSFTISDPDGNNNGRLDPGETVNITFPVHNTGHSTSPVATAMISSASPFITINTGNATLGQIAAAGSANAVFNLTCSPGTPIGQPVDLNLNVDAGYYSFDHDYVTSVGLVLEDWETGTFETFPWTFSCDMNWSIVGDNPYEGAYTAKSGVVEDDQSSSMSVTLLVNADDTISFYRKVSSESNYDYLQFYIDDVQKAQWSGTVGWGKVSYPVSSGIRTFKWTYSKDYSVSSGSDCGWVDYIVFPPSTIVAPEIDVTPASFNKAILLSGYTTDILNIANSGNIPLDFTAQIDYSTSNKSQLIVYPVGFDYRTGTCTSSNKTEPSLVKGYPTTEAGWMMFDVSSIPDGAVINSVEFHGYVNATSFPYWNINPVTNNPLTASASTLYTDIMAEANAGYYLHRNETSSYSTGWKVHTLEGNANSDLQDALAQNWFAIGIMDRDNSSNYYIGFDGWNESNVPYLIIDYDYTPTYTWLQIDGGTSLVGTVDEESSQEIEVAFDAGTYPEGTYEATISILSNDPDQSQVIVPCTMIITGGMNVSIKAFLEGPFENSAMNSSIGNIIPLSQPYNSVPWNYTGTESVTSMPVNVVDWVMVELRDATSASQATPDTRIARQAALLFSDGSITAVDGTSPLFFTEGVVNSLFVVICHRNHLDIMSANAVIQSGGNYTYDFTTSVDQAYGTDAEKQLAPGVWGMMSGDANADGMTDGSDIDPAWKANACKAGYIPADLNLDGQVDNRDKDSFWIPNVGMGTNLPE